MLPEAHWLELQVWTHAEVLGNFPTVPVSKLSPKSFGPPWPYLTVDTGIETMSIIILVDLISNIYQDEPQQTKQSPHHKRQKHHAAPEILLLRNQSWGSDLSAFNRHQCKIQMQKYK